MSVNAVMMGAAFVRLTIDDASLQQGLNRSQNKIKMFVTSVNTWASQITTMGTLLAAPFVMTTKTFAAFDDRMRQVQAVTDATGNAFDMLTKEAKRLGRETSFTAAQVSEGMLALGRMGFSPDQIKSTIVEVMNLSRVTGTELSEAAEIAANNMRVFNLEADDMEHVADILSVTANSSAQTLVDLGESLKMAGPHAKRAGADLAETATALGILANMGIRGSLAGTALGKSYKRLADPKVIAYLKQYNVATLNADGSMRKMRDTLVDIAKTMKTMTNAEQIMFAEEVFDARGSLGGGTLSVNTDGIDQLLEKLKNTKGATATASEKMDEGIGGALRELESAAEGVSIMLGEVVAVSFSPLVAGATKLLLYTRGLINENRHLLGALLLISSALIGCGAAIKAWIFGTKIIKALIAPINALDAVVKGTKAAATAAAVAEKQQEMAAATAAAKSAAAEKMKTAVKEAETAKRLALSAQENAAVLAESQARFAANSRLIAASNTKIAQAKAESAVTGQSATAFIAAENAKQAELAETNLVLSQQITIQKTAAAISAKSATLAQAQAVKSMQTANNAANLSKAATAAEIAYGVSLKSSSALVVGKAAHIAKALKNQKASAMFASASSAMLASANTKTILSAIMVTEKTKVVTKALYAKALGIKIAAKALTGLRAAMTALAAHPVTLALIAMVSALWAINKAFSATNARAREFSELMQKNAETSIQYREQGDNKRQNATAEFVRLKQLEELAKKGQLTAKEMDEAEGLMKSLGQFGSTYWATLDKTSRKLQLVADAQEQLNKQLAAAAKKDLESEIAALRAEQSALYAENDKLTEGRNFNFLASISGRMADVTSQLEVNDDRAAAIMAKKQAAILRLVALDDGDKNAVTGIDGGKSTLQARIDAEKKKQEATAEEIAQAEKRIQEMDDEAAKRKMSNLEREISEIAKLRKEYNDYIDVLLKAQKANLVVAQSDMRQNKEGKTQAQKDTYIKAFEQAKRNSSKIAELEARRLAANAGFDLQMQKAKNNEAEHQKPYAEFLDELDADKQKRDVDKQAEKDFSSAMQNKNYEAAYALVEQLFNIQKLATQNAREKYQQMFGAATSLDSDGGTNLTESERSKLDELKVEIRNGASKMENYQSKMDEAREAASAAEVRDPSAKVSGAWRLADLSGLFNSTAVDRTATATEKSVALQEKAIKWLDAIEKKTGSSTLKFF